MVQLELGFGQSKCNSLLKTMNCWMIHLSISNVSEDWLCAGFCWEPEHSNEHHQTRPWSWILWSRKDDQTLIKEPPSSVLCSSGKMRGAVSIVNGRRGASSSEEPMLALRSEGWSGGVREEKPRRAFRAERAGCTWAPVHLRNWESSVHWESGHG